MEPNESATKPISHSGVLPPGKYRLFAISGSYATRMGGTGGNTVCETGVDFDFTISGSVDCTQPGAGVKVGFARACGTALRRTAPDSSIHRTTTTAWVGGFEIRPREGGALVVDIELAQLREEGTGVEVLFAGHAMPFPASNIPVNLPSGSMQLQLGLNPQLFSVPVKGSAGVAWTADGSGAGFAAEVAVEKLAEVLAGSGSILGGFPDGSGNLTATLRNGVGFQLGDSELSIKEVSVTPGALNQARPLKLKDLLLKHELREGKSFWTGQAGIEFPVGKAEIAVVGRVYLSDGSFRRRRAAGLRIRRADPAIAVLPAVARGRPRLLPGLRLQPRHRHQRRPEGRREGDRRADRQPARTCRSRPAARSPPIRCRST